MRPQLTPSLSSDTCDHLFHTLRLCIRPRYLRVSRGQAKPPLVRKGDEQPYLQARSETLRRPVGPVRVAAPQTPAPCRQMPAPALLLHHRYQHPLPVGHMIVSAGFCVAQMFHHCRLMANRPNHFLAQHSSFCCTNSCSPNEQFGRFFSKTTSLSLPSNTSVVTTEACHVPTEHLESVARPPLAVAQLLLQSRFLLDMFVKNWNASR